MKYITTFTILSLLASLLTFSNCGGGGDDPGPKPTEQERVRSLMTANLWKIQNITVGGINAMELFTNLSVTFTDTGFTTTNGGPVWPASGTWQFANNQATKILRSDGKEITITTIDANTFKCTLYWDKTIYGGRAHALEGEHSFTFSK